LAGSWARSPVGQAVRMRRRRRVGPVIERSAFARFPPEVIAVAVRWYLRYGLSYRDVEELLAERGVEVDHVTVFRAGSSSGRCGRRRGRWR
jgi:transposase-like protein